jgi:hypothetical protein
VGIDWGAPVDAHAAYRRAGGRRKLNAARRARRDQRRALILHWAARFGLSLVEGRGLQAAFARDLRVSRATISRDFQAIRAADRGAPLE